jgi:guanylate kinase
MSKRLKSAQAELAYVSEYDYVIVNDELEKATEKLKSVIIAEKCKPQRKEIKFE